MTHVSVVKQLIAQDKPMGQFLTATQELFKMKKKSLENFASEQLNVLLRMPWAEIQHYVTVVMQLRLGSAVIQLSVVGQKS